MEGTCVPFATIGLNPCQFEWYCVSVDISLQVDAISINCIINVNEKEVALSIRLFEILYKNTMYYAHDGIENL